MAQQRLADLDFLADAETLGKFLDFFVKNSVTALDYFLGKFFQKSVVVCVYFSIVFIFPPRADSGFHSRVSSG